MLLSTEKLEKMVVIAVAIFMVVAVLLFAIRPINKVTNIRTIEGTVTEKTVQVDDGGSKYLVFIEDEDHLVIPLEVSDAWLRLRFNSSDVYGNIRVGQKYAFEVGGSRWEPLSWYPNIYSFEEIE